MASSMVLPSIHPSQRCSTSTTAMMSQSSSQKNQLKIRTIQLLGSTVTSKNHQKLKIKGQQSIVSQLSSKADWQSNKVTLSSGKASSEKLRAEGEISSTRRFIKTHQECPTRQRSPQSLASKTPPDAKVKVDYVNSSIVVDKKKIERIVEKAEMSNSVVSNRVVTTWSPSVQCPWSPSSSTSQLSTDRTSNQPSE